MNRVMNCFESTQQAFHVLLAEIEEKRNRDLYCFICHVAVFKQMFVPGPDAEEGLGA